jgi:hypothetical protein
MVEKNDNNVYSPFFLASFLAFLERLLGLPMITVKQLGF